MENAINELKNKQFEFEAATGDKIKEFKAVEQENKNRISELEAALKKLQDESDNKQNDIKRIQATIASQQIDVNNLKVNYEKSDEALKNLKYAQFENESALQELEEKMKLKEEQIEQQQKQIEGMSDDFKKKNEDFAKKQEQLKVEFEKEKNKLQEEINSINDKNNKLSEEIKQKNEEVQKQLKEYRDKNNEVNIKLNSLQCVVDTTNNLIKELNEAKSNIEENKNIKQISVDNNNKQIKFRDNKKDVPDINTIEKGYSYNDIIFITEMIKECRKALKNIDVEKKEDLKKFQEIVKKIGKNVEANFEKKIKYDPLKMNRNDVVLQFDVAVKDCKASEFIYKYIAYEPEVGAKVLKNYINDCYSSEVYIDDIISKKDKFSLDTRALHTKEKGENDDNIVCIDEVKDFFKEYDKNPIKQRLYADNTIFSMLEFNNAINGNLRNMGKDKIDEYIKNIEDKNNEIDTLNKERQSKLLELDKFNKKEEEYNEQKEKIEDERNKAFDAYIHGSGTEKEYEEKDKALQDINKTIFENEAGIEKIEAEISIIDKKLEVVNDKKIELDSVDETYYSLNFYSQIMFKLVGEKFTEEEIEKIVKEKGEYLKQLSEEVDKKQAAKGAPLTDEEVDEVFKNMRDIVLEGILTKLGDKKIKDGNYHFIFYGDINAFDSFIICVD